MGRSGWLQPPRSRALKPKLPLQLLPALRAGEPGPAAIREEQLQLTRQADACRSVARPRCSSRQVQPSSLTVPAGTGPSSPAAVGQQWRCLPKHLLHSTCPAAQDSRHVLILLRKGACFPLHHSQGYRDAILLQLKDAMVEASSFGPTALCNTIYRRLISHTCRKEGKKSNALPFLFLVCFKSAEHQQTAAPLPKRP